MITYGQIRQAVQRAFHSPGAGSFVIAGNWKMNMTAAEGRAFLQAFLPCPDRERVVLFPPGTTLALLAEELKQADIGFGPQNMHEEPCGAFTGEISLPMVQELGCSHVLLGHSERRIHYAENSSALAKKVRTAVGGELHVVLCIGETLEERIGQTWQDVLFRQLEEVLTGLTEPELARLSIAYEPVWAIGTGRSASAGEIAQTHRYIKQVLQAVCCRTLPVLYGGSVNGKNAMQIAQVMDVDGFLVGGASLRADAFREIIRAARKAERI